MPNSRKLPLRLKLYSTGLFLIGIACLFGAYFLASSNFVTSFPSAFVPAYIFWIWSTCSLVKAAFCFTASRAIYEQSVRLGLHLQVLSYLWLLTSLALLLSLSGVIIGLPSQSRPSWNLLEWLQAVLGVFTELASPFLLRKWIKESFLSETTGRLISRL